MDRNDVTWRGYWPAVPTPFDEDGAFLENSLRQVLDGYVAAGVHGVLVNGSAGEWWAQSADERRRTAAVAVDAVGGRIPVVIGCTSFTADAVIALAEHAATIGADGVLTTPPPYAHPTQEEIVAFYAAIDRSISLPLVAYNWPRGTAVELSLDSARRIAALERVVAIKNSTSDWPLVVDYIEALASEVRIFASLINPRGLAILRELGGDGYIDGGGLGAPFAVPFFEAVWEGRVDDAREHAVRYWELTTSFVNSDFSGRFGSPSAQLKAAMAILGQPGGAVRPPLQPITDRDKLVQIEHVLERTGLLVAAA
jgi:1-pyrroline-4-hydroxy-2-carboxylate deaminase